MNYRSFSLNVLREFCCGSSLLQPCTVLLLTCFFVWSEIRCTFLHLILSEMGSGFRCLGQHTPIVPKLFLVSPPPPPLLHTHSHTHSGIYQAIQNLALHFISMFQRHCSPGWGVYKDSVYRKTINCLRYNNMAIVVY